MQTTSISQLKKSLSAYLRLVQGGEDVFITNRGRPEARLTSEPYSDSLEVHLEELEGKGFLKQGNKSLPADFWDMPRPADPQGLVREAISLDRDENWWN